MTSMKILYTFGLSFALFWHCFCIIGLLFVYFGFHLCISVGIFVHVSFFSVCFCLIKERKTERKTGPVGRCEKSERKEKM